MSTHWKGTNKYNRQFCCEFQIKDLIYQNSILSPYIFELLTYFNGVKDKALQNLSFLDDIVLSTKSTEELELKLG